MIGKFRDMPPSRCPYCGKPCDWVTGVSNGAIPPTWPDPGSISLCTECGELLMFDERLQLRKLTGDEFASVAMSPVWTTIRMSQQVIRQLRRARMGVYN